MADRFAKSLTVVPSPGAPAKSDNAERRKVTRYPFTAAAKVIETRSQASVSGRVSDLSLGGCYVDSVSPLPEGSDVSIHIEYQGLAFEAVAKVVYALASMGMGVAFTEISPDQMITLRKWISDLGGEIPDQATATPGAPSAGAVEEIQTIKHVLNQVITTLMRHRVLNESEAAALLRDLFR